MGEVVSLAERRTHFLQQAEELRSLFFRPLKEKGAGTLRAPGIGRNVISQF
jgi:hypothetical protein